MSIFRRALLTSAGLLQSTRRLVNPLAASRIPSFATYIPIRNMADMTPVFSKDAAPRWCHPNLTTVAGPELTNDDP
jgi:hypothetical protein